MRGYQRHDSTVARRREHRRRVWAFRPDGCLSGLEERVLLAADPFTLTPATLPNDTVGHAYNQTLGATGATGTVTFAVTSGALPAGLTLTSSTGAITGTPTTAGTDTFTVTGTDSTNATGTGTYTVDINPAITFTTTTLPAATLNTAYSHQLATTGGTGAVTFAVTNNTLPTGLTLSSSGLLSGTPTVAGPSTFTVTATDSVGATTPETYTLGVNATAFTINQTSLPNATSGTAYSQQLSSTGGTGTVTFGVTSGTLPTGMTLSTTGLLSGTPTSTGPSTFIVTATDASSHTATQAFQVEVNPAISITTTTLPAATVNTPYTQQLAATGGTGALTFSLATGSTLPTGLTLSSSGTISGTPTAAGSSSFTINASDTAGATTPQTFNFTVNAAMSTLSIIPTTLPNGTVNTNYSQQLSTTGGTGTSTFAVTTGALPTGLTLSSAGLISGTPTVAGTDTFTVTATDTANDTATQSYTVTVNGPITFITTSLPNATVDTAYSQQVVTTGGVAPLTFAVTTGSLPAGLSLSSAGLISGTPTAAGTSSFTVTAADSTGATNAEPFTLTVGTTMSTTGPTVTNLQRFGFHNQPTIFVLTFNEGLNAASAQNINNYTLVPIVNGTAGTPIPLSSAVYDATNNTVTLSPANTVYLFAQYQLTVNGTSPSGVTDTSGNFLAGANGASGTNFVQTFGQEILAGPNVPSSAVGPAVAARIVNQWNNGGQAQFAALNAQVASLEARLTGPVAPSVAHASKRTSIVFARRTRAAILRSLEHSHSKVARAVLSKVVVHHAAKKHHS